MVIYLDLVVLLNFSVDFLLLLGTNRLTGHPAEPGRCALGAALGAVYAGMCLLPGFAFLGNLLWRTVALGLMGAAVFGLHREALQRTGIFLLLSLAMGGAALSMGRGEGKTLLLCAGVIWLLCRICLPDGTAAREYVPVTIRSGGRDLRLLALKDTGNELRDPVTGQQVLVISAGAARELTGLSPDQLASPLETMLAGALPGLRLVPCRTVGGSGMLLAKTFPEVTVGNSRGSHIVAFAMGELEGTGRYQALTGGAI